ncbi:5-formyltetrahydrofolate cyclo-ligase [Mycoplasmatota bacterium WC44]
MCLSKKELRRKVLKKRLALSKDDVLKRSKIIIDMIKDELNLSEMTGLFMPIKNEVDLTSLLGENVALPRIIDKMIFCKYTGELVLGKYDILESTGEEVDVKILIVPGSVFDKSGYRIGYGGGYYDRYMNNNHIKVGVCFDFQLVESVPKEKHDVKLDMLITDKEIYRW